MVRKETQKQSQNNRYKVRQGDIKETSKEGQRQKSISQHEREIEDKEREDRQEEKDIGIDRQKGTKKQGKRNTIEINHFVKEEEGELERERKMLIN